MGSQRLRSTSSETSPNATTGGRYSLKQLRKDGLYVDYDEYGDVWSVPEDANFEEYFGSSGVLDRAMTLFKPLREVQLGGFLRSDSLAVLNATFRNHFITDTTSWKDIESMYSKAATRLESDLGLSSTAFLGSSLIRWPLYPFVARWL